MKKVAGVLDRLDDFGVSLTQADGTHRSFRTTGNTPAVEVHDPLQPHKDLLRVYTDADIHKRDGVSGDIEMRNDRSAKAFALRVGSNAKLAKRLVVFAVVAGFAFHAMGALSADGGQSSQGLDPAQILKPLTESWPTYSGDYTGRRYSALKQVNQANVKNLTLAWVAKVANGPGGGGGRGGGFGGAAGPS